MSGALRVSTTRRFDRLARVLRRQHPGVFTESLRTAIAILEYDPFNETRRHPIRKLQGVAAGDGQYRLRLGHWRFRYDVSASAVVLHYCGLRREDTYR
jgi:hypothetical protein